MPVTINVDTRGFNELREQLGDMQRNIPFALSVALNKAANSAQGDIQRSITEGGKFQVRRRDFLIKTIYRKPGQYPGGDFPSKNNLTARVRIHPERDVLLKHEADTVKRAQNGGRLAIPLVRMDKPELVIKQGHRYNLAAMPTVAGASAMSMQRPKRGAGVTFYATQMRRGGNTVIWEARGKRTKPKAIWLLTPRPVGLTPRLGMVDTAHRAFERDWPGLFTQALEQALRPRREMAGERGQP